MSNATFETRPLKAVSVIFEPGDMTRYAFDVVHSADGAHVTEPHLHLSEAIHPDWVRALTSDAPEIVNASREDYQELAQASDFFPRIVERTPKGVNPWTLLAAVVVLARLELGQS